jgi:hypothetical protein
MAGRLAPLTGLYVLAMIVSRPGPSRRSALREIRGTFDRRKARAGARTERGSWTGERRPDAGREKV